MTTYLALCSDPNASPEALDEALKLPNLTTHERAAILSNPMLSLESLFFWLCDGNPHPLLNPMLPLLLLSDPMGEDSEGNEIHLSAAVGTCLWHRVAKLCDAMPREKILPALRAWTFAAAWDATRFWADPEMLFKYSGIPDAWKHAQSPHSKAGDGCVDYFVRIACGSLLGRDHTLVPSLLALVTDLLAIGLPEECAADLFAVRKATDLLGHAPPTPRPDPRQLNLFDEVAA